MESIKPDFSTIEEGDEISGTPKEMTLDLMQRFSGHLDGGVNIHTNEKMAIEAGLPEPIAQGMMSYGYILEMIITEFGHRWLNGGELQVAFLQYVFPGDTITAKGKVVRKETDSSGIKITLKVWCLNQRNEKVVAGSATGLI